MNIVVVNLAIASPKYGPTYRTHYLAENWAQHGHKVTVVGTSFSHLLKNEVPVCGSYLETDENGVRYFILKTLRYSGSGGRRLLNLLYGIIGLWRHQKRIVGHRRPDIIISSSVYQIDNYWALHVARKYGAKFIRETRDLWPMTLTELGGKSRNNPFVRWVQCAEDLGYRRAHLVSTTLAESFEYMSTRGLSRNRWVWLPQCPAPERSDSVCPTLPVSHLTALKSARARGDLIVAFTGSFVPSSDFDTLIEAAVGLRSERVAIFLVGQGPLERCLRARVDHLRLSNVYILPAIPKELVRPLLSLCDVGVQIFKDLPIYRYGVSPNKVFEYMSAGLPVILAVSTNLNPVSASTCGFVVTPGKPLGIVDSIRALNRMSSRARRDMGQRGRVYVKQKHDIVAVAKRYIELFKQMRGTSS